MYRDTVDLNCDMGEGFGHWAYGDVPDSVLMPLISSANVATGYHPGYHDLQGFGRRAIAAKPEELINDILYQTGSLREFGKRHGIPLQHVKPRCAGS